MMKCQTSNRVGGLFGLVGDACLLFSLVVQQFFFCRLFFSFFCFLLFSVCLKKSSILGLTFFEQQQHKKKDL